MTTTLEKLAPKHAAKMAKLISTTIEPQVVLYDILGELSSGMDPDIVLADLAQDHIGFKSSAYNSFREKRDKNDELVTKPPEIKEGEIECPKCHKKFTLVIEMQTRSADEGYTYYTHCFNPDCKAISKTN